MTILNIKSTFKQVAKVSLAPAVAEYHPAIIASFSKKIITPSPVTTAGKITFNPPPNHSTGSAVQQIAAGLKNGNFTVPSITAIPAPIMVFPIASATFGSATPAGLQTPVSNVTFNAGRAASETAPKQILTPTASSVSFAAGKAAISTGPHTPATISTSPSASGSVPNHGSLLAPTIEPNSETSTGNKLENAEKPYIVSVLSQNIVSGLPQKNTIFIKALASKTKKAIKYTVFRKDLFSNTDFLSIAEVGPNQPEFATKYKTTIQQHPGLSVANFAIEDEFLNKNKVYVYKVKIEWVFMTADELVQNNLGLSANGLKALLGLQNAGLPIMELT